jgi:cell wall-active antibiotic response 4TMS protein YvqF/B-box zinc finger protein
MNCQNHPDAPAVAYCRTCGKALCEECRRDAYGTVFCEEHQPAPAFAAPPPQAAAPPAVSPSGEFVYCDCSPGWALALGLLIPGVGAIYNGQYAKGLVHAVVFGLLTSIVSSGSAGGLEPLFGLLIAAWVFYMGFEAYHTAWKRRRGEPVDEFSSIVDLRGQAGRFPVAAVVLIVLGALLLLNTLDILSFQYLVRYWPLLLIGLGVYLLWARATAPGEPHAEVRHERQ